MPDFTKEELDKANKTIKELEKKLQLVTDHFVEKDQYIDFTVDIQTSEITGMEIKNKNEHLYIHNFYDDTSRDLFSESIKYDHLMKCIDKDDYSIIVNFSEFDIRRFTCLNKDEVMKDLFENIEKYEDKYFYIHLHVDDQTYFILRPFNSKDNKQLEDLIKKINEYGFDINFTEDNIKFKCNKKLIPDSNWNLPSFDLDCIIYNYIRLVEANTIANENIRANEETIKNYEKEILELRDKLYDMQSDLKAMKKIESYKNFLGV